MPYQITDGLYRGQWLHLAISSFQFIIFFFEGSFTYIHQILEVMARRLSVRESSFAIIVFLGITRQDHMDLFGEKKFVKKKI